jgi:lipid-binding SYLF domain-containing protein
MNSKLGRSVISALCAGIAFCFAAISTPAQDYHQTYSQLYSQPYPQSYSRHYSRPGLSSRAASKGDDMDNALKGSADATKIFLDIADAQNKIPQGVLRNAAAVGVFKGVFNLALIGGHRQGDGAITIRTPGGWSAPVFYKLRGGRVGQEVGASPTDYLLIFMSRESIKDIANGELDLNLDANAVAGPVSGAEGTALHRAFPNSKTVFVYSRGKESLAGAVIDDAKLIARDGVNRDLYGMNAFALLSDPSPLPNMCTACLTPGVADFPQTVVAAPNPQPAQVVVPQPQIAPPQEFVWTRTAPRNRNRGVQVIVIKIINEAEDEDEEEEEEEVTPVIVQPQLQPQPIPVVTCCPRPHKRKL